MPSNPKRSPTSIEVRYGSEWKDLHFPYTSENDITMNSLLRFLTDSSGMIENIYTDDLKDFNSYLDFSRRNNRLTFYLKVWGFPDKYIIRVIFCGVKNTQAEVNMREKFMSFAVFWWGNNKDAHLNPTVEPFIRAEGGEVNAD